MSVLTDSNNINFEVCHYVCFCKEYLTLVLKNCRLLFYAVISQHFSKNRVIISVVAAKIWYLKNVRFLLGHPVYLATVSFQVPAMTHTSYMIPRRVLAEL